MAEIDSNQKVKLFFLKLIQLSQNHSHSLVHDTVLLIRTTCCSVRNFLLQAIKSGLSYGHSALNWSWQFFPMLTPDHYAHKVVIMMSIIPLVSSIHFQTLYLNGRRCCKVFLNLNYLQLDNVSQTMFSIYSYTVRFTWQIFLL